MSLTYDEAWAKYRSYSEADYRHVRRLASDHLSQQMRDELGPDHGHGISSSDTNHHAVSMLLEDENCFEADLRILRRMDAMTPEQLADMRTLLGVE